MMAPTSRAALLGVSRLCSAKGGSEGAREGRGEWILWPHKVGGVPLNVSWMAWELLDSRDVPRKYTRPRAGGGCWWSGSYRLREWKVEEEITEPDTVCRATMR